MRPEPFVCGLVLAAGGSSRLGRPKQLLPYRGATLLDAVLGTARACEFDQLVVVLGGSSREVRAAVDLSGTDVVVNEAFGSGCSSSIAAALGVVDPACDVLVLVLGDQPGVSSRAVSAVVAGRGDARIAVCAYSDGRGHPFAFARSSFRELSGLQGDKAVWKLLEHRADEVVDVPVEGPVPRDVDTWKDYDAVVAAAGQ
jgi:molybdenum cofactor cytidylyltransferase